MADFDYLKGSIVKQTKEVMITGDKSRYTNFFNLHNVHPDEIEEHLFLGTFIRQPKRGIHIRFTKKSVEFTYSGAFFRTRNCYKKLRGHLNFFKREYGDLVRFNRVDLALVLPSQTGSPEELLYFNKNNKIKKRKNTKFRASKFYTLDKEDNIHTDGIYYGGLQRRLVLYSIKQELEAHSNENKENFYRHNLKEKFETSIKAEIKFKNRSSLTNKHLDNLLDGKYTELYLNLIQGFFRDFELQTKDGNPTRPFINIRNKFLTSSIEG